MIIGCMFYMNNIINTGMFGLRKKVKWKKINLVESEMIGKFLGKK